MDRVNIEYYDYAVQEEGVVDWFFITLFGSLDNKKTDITNDALLECILKTYHIKSECVESPADTTLPILYEKAVDKLDSFIPKIVLEKHLKMVPTTRSNFANITIAELLIPVFKSPEATLVDKLLILMLVYYIVDRTKSCSKSIAQSKQVRKRLCDVKSDEPLVSDIVKTRINLDCTKFRSKGVYPLYIVDVYSKDPMALDKYLTQEFNEVVSIYYLEDHSEEDSLIRLIATAIFIVNTYHQMCAV